MAINGSSVPTLVDLLTELAPDGSALRTAEVLTQNTEILEDMPWIESNGLDTHKESVRTSLPEPEFRTINAGVGTTRGNATPITEGVAMLEDFSECDRELAIKSGDVGTYRAKQAKPHLIGFAHKMAKQVIYGNANAAGAEAEFTGLAARFNSLDTASYATAQQVISAGGSGTGLRSIYIVGWDEETVTGLYPKNTPAGLHHEDATGAAGTDENGNPNACVLFDAAGKKYMGYRDHWTWRCGLMVKDWRYVVRVANLDLDTITNSTATTNLEDILIQATERLQSKSGVRAAIYMPRALRTLIRRQMSNTKSAFLSRQEYGGHMVEMFDDIPIRVLDCLNTEETQVV